MTDGGSESDGSELRARVVDLGGQPVWLGSIGEDRRDVLERIKRQVIVGGEAVELLAGDRVAEEEDIVEAGEELRLTVVRYAIYLRCVVKIRNHDVLEVVVGASGLPVHIETHRGRGARLRRIDPAEPTEEETARGQGLYARAPPGPLPLLRTSVWISDDVDDLFEDYPGSWAGAHGSTFSDEAAARMLRGLLYAISRARGLDPLDRRTALRLGYAELSVVWSERETERVWRRRRMWDVDEVEDGADIVEDCRANSDEFYAYLAAMEVIHHTSTPWALSEALRQAPRERLQSGDWYLRCELVRSA